jgi:hypothetical protein
VWADCTRAWLSVTQSDTNYVRGATVWGNAKDVEQFKKTKWFKSYEMTAQVGGHYFFKEKKGEKK